MKINGVEARVSRCVAGGSPDLAEDERRTDMESRAEARRMGRNERSAKRRPDVLPFFLQTSAPLRLCASAPLRESLPRRFHL